MDEIHEVTGMKLAELRDVTTERKMETASHDGRKTSKNWQHKVTRYYVRSTFISGRFEPRKLPLNTPKIVAFVTDYINAYRESSK